MSKVHHTQVKMAAKLGGTLTQSDNNPNVFIATLGSQTFLGQSPKEALDKLIAAATPAKVARAPKPKKEKAPAKGKKRPKKRKSGDDDGEEEEAEGKGSVVKAKYKKIYQPTHDTNGDEFAGAFRAATVNDDEMVDVNKLNHVARDNGLKITQWMHLKNRDGGINVGMIRMNLGNVLRGMVRNGKGVKIGDQTFKGLPPKEKVKKPRKPKAPK